jgi:hypothetical protein
MPAARPNQAEHGVAVAAGQAQEGPPGAAQENQGPDHGDHPQDEPHDGGGAGPSPEFFKRESGNHGPQNEAQDLRPQVLHHRGPVDADGPGDVPLEAGHANAHVAGVAPLLEQGRQDADKNTHADDPDSGGEKFLYARHVTISSIPFAIAWSDAFLGCIEVSIFRTNFRQLMTFSRFRNLLVTRFSGSASGPFPA